MRLVTLLPAMVVAPAGLICYGMTAQKQGHWFGYMAGVAMSNWGSYWYFTNTLVSILILRVRVSSWNFDFGVTGVTLFGSPWRLTFRLMLWILIMPTLLKCSLS